MAGESIDKLEIEVEASASSANNSLSRLTSKLKSLQQGLDRLDTQELKDVAESLSKLGSVNFEGFNHIPSPSKFKRLADGISSLADIDTEKLNEVANSLDKISSSSAALGGSGNGNIQIPSVSSGATAQDVSSIDNATHAEENLNNAINNVANSQEKAKDATSQAGQSSQSSSEQSTSAFNRLGEAIQKFISSASSAASVGSRLTNSLGRVGSSALKVEKNALGAGKSLAEICLQTEPLGKIPGVFDKIKTSCSGLDKEMSKLVNLFTMMAVRKAYTAIFEGMGTAFDHLAQKSSEVNTRFSQLQSSLSQLTHSITALADPLLRIFGPALEYIINLLNTAVNYINQFLSAITGKTYITSKNVATDYAASLQDDADSATAAANAQKELNKQLQSFNELNNLTTNESSGSGGGTGSGTDVGDLEDCYEEMAINQKILDLVEQLKDLLATIFEPMKAAWDKYGQDVIDSMEYALSSVWQLIKDMGKTWLEVWTNGSGEELCSNILKLLTSMFNWIGDIAVAWDEAWITKGEAYVQSIFDLLNSVLETVIDISETFREAFNDGAGREMIEHIYQILTNTNNIIKDMVLSFKSAWDEAGRGQAIAEAFFTAINDILTAIEKMQEAWANVWNNGTGLKICEQILDLVHLIEDAVDQVAIAFTNAWENGGAGEAVIQSILDMFSSILQVIYDIGSSLLTVWSSGSGEEIIGHILQIFKDINDAVGGLFSAFDKAWTKADSGTGILQGLADICNTMLGHVENIYDNFAAWISDLDFGPLLQTFNDIVEAVKPLANKVGEGLEWFYKNVAEPLLKWAIENGIPAVFEAIAGALELLGSIVEKIQKPLQWLWDNILSPIASWTGGVICDVLNGVGESLSGLASVINGDESAFTWFTDLLKGAGSYVIDVAVNLVKNLWKTVKGWVCGDGDDKGAVETAIDCGVSLVKKVGNWASDAWEAIKSIGKNDTEVDTTVTKTSSSDEDAVTAINAATEGRQLSSHVSTEITTDSSSDETAISAISNLGKSVTTTISTKFEQAADSAKNAITGIENIGKTAVTTVSEKLIKGEWAEDAWTALQAGATSVKNTAETGVKLVKSGWDTITGWFKDKFGSLFGGSSDDESISVKVKLNKKDSDKVSDILDDTQTVAIKLSDKSDKLSKVLDDEFTTKVKISSKSDKLSSILDETFTTTVKLSDKSEKLNSILDDTFTTKVKLEKSGWDTFEKWIGGTDVDANVSLKPAASSLWKTLKTDWDLASGTVDFSADVKDESATWWKNTKSYWSKKVGTVDKFSTDVLDEAVSWWKNAQTYWSKKVGTAEYFKTDILDEGATWWKNTQTYWKKVVGYVEDFRVKVKDDSTTWWNDVSTYWTNKSSSKYLTVNVRGVVETATDWWTAVNDKLKSKIGTVYANVRGKVYTESDWWSSVASKVKSYIGTVYVNVRGQIDYSYNWWTSCRNGIKNAIGTVTVSVNASYKAKGGIFQNGAWSDIPQYAGGTLNAGSMFIAGEQGAELVGHIGGRTEVLNESQLATVMETSVLEGVASLGGYLNSLYKQMTVCANGIIGAIAVNYEQPEVISDTSGSSYTTLHNSVADQVDPEMKNIVSLLTEIADNTSYDESIESDPNQLFRIVRQKNKEYKLATGKSAF